MTMRITQIGFETMIQGDTARVTQFGVEVIAEGDTARITQLGVEIIAVEGGAPEPPVVVLLPGLGRTQIIT